MASFLKKTPSIKNVEALLLKGEIRAKERSLAASASTKHGHSGEFVVKGRGSSLANRSPQKKR